MKKSLLALAVLGAFAGAASAQSSVTIYGKIDLGIAKTNDAAAGSSTFLNGAPTTDKVTMQPGARSRLGFRGTEDLGGGLKANFNIEHSFKADEGTLETQNPGNNNMWSQSWLGLSGGFGEVRLGRDYAPHFYAAIMGDPFGYDTIGQAGAGHTQAGVATSRLNNQISYKSPSFAGVTAMVAFAPREAATGNNALGANVMYSAGPLALGFGWQDAGNQNIVAGATETNLYILTAAYDLGFVRPIVQYSKGTADNAAGAEIADFDNILVGATAPLGGGELKALYTVRDNDIANSDIKKFGLGYHYPLSKRTKVYADLGTAKEDGVSERRTAFDIGVQHNF
jgi:predicted porin